MAKKNSERPITAGGRTLAKPRSLGGAGATKKKRKTWFHKCGPSCAASGARGRGTNG